MSQMRYSSGQRGFTLIEVILFFAITGLMFVGIFAAASASVNQQRYKDSVTSLIAKLQEQYAAVVNVSNERQLEVGVCASAASQTQGRSECAIIGRYITGSGGSLTVAPVIATHDYQRTAAPFASYLDGVEKSGSSYASIDTAVLGLASPKVVETMKDDYQVPWDANIVTTRAQGSAPYAFTLLAVRSPYSGAIRTFISRQPDASMTQLLTDSAAQYGMIDGNVMCIDGGYAMGKLAVEILPGTTSAAGVRLKGDTNDC